MRRKSNRVMRHFLLSCTDREQKEVQDNQKKRPPEWVFSTVLQDGANFIPTEIAQIGV